MSKGSFHMCKDCKDTGEIQLFTSVVPCGCLCSVNPSSDNYVDAIEAVDLNWMSSCCSCHISPPCGFCLRYADAGLDEPSYCDICGQPSPVEGPKLCSCVT